TVNFCSKLYCLTKKKIKNIIIKNISVENIELSPFRLQITMQFWEYYTYVRYNQYEISFMKWYKMISYITYIYYNRDKEDLIVWENI
ncbi:hypothetical protein Q604_UNBc4C00106G0001, partial [human gut metagenome]